MRSVLWSAAVLILIAVARPAAGQQLGFQFADAAGTPQATFPVAVGETVAVRVYLRDLQPGAPTLNADGGLGSAAARVFFNTPGGVAAVLGTGDISAGTTTGTPVGPWAFATNSFHANSDAGFAAGSPINAGVLPDANGRVYLGTLTFHGVAEGSTTITAKDYNPAAGFDTTSFISFTNYDPFISQATATITVAAPIPEPAGLLAAGLAVGGVATLIRRRRASRTA